MMATLTSLRPSAAKGPVQLDLWTAEPHGAEDKQLREKAKKVVSHWKRRTECQLLSAAAEGRFNRLRDEWKTQSRHESSTKKLISLPAYQEIIGMGQDAVPFLLRELQMNLDNWFWALMVITKEDPVPDEFRGDGAAMAVAWIQWGKEHGFEW